MRTKLVTLILCLVATTSFVRSQNANEDFKTFLDKFTTSASFQQGRVKFPLQNSILLLNNDGEEREFPFVKEMWPLLDSEAFKEERVVQEEGAVYVARFVVDEPDKKEFEAGYEESDIDLRVAFQLIDGKWYVTDCYNGWYSFDLPAEEFERTVEEVQEVNKEFIEQFP